MNLQIIFWCFFYVSCSSTLSVVKQYLNLFGISDKSTLLLSQTTFLAYSFSGTRFFSNSNLEIKKEKSRASSTLYIVAYSLIGLIGTFFLNLGLSYCGSGIYQVLYSSIIIHTAVISYLINGKMLSFTKMIGILVIFIGLSTSAIPLFFYPQSKENNVLFGVFLCLFGTFIYSLNYIIDEYLIVNFEKYQITSQELSFKTGLLSFLISFIFQIIYVFPIWNEATIRVKDWKMVILFISIQFFADVFNSISYYKAIALVGATTCGVMKGLVSIVVFSLSSLLFCSIQPHQCFTIFKGISTLIVVFGIVIYSLGSQQKEKKE